MADVEDLAKAFTVELRETLTAEEWGWMYESNKQESNPGVCHSHDFCDANECMAEAWKKLGGDDEQILGDSDEGRAVWGAAWDLAKKNELGSGMKDKANVADLVKGRTFVVSHSWHVYELRVYLMDELTAAEVAEVFNNAVCEAAGFIWGEFINVAKLSSNGHGAYVSIGLRVRNAPAGTGEKWLDRVDELSAVLKKHGWKEGAR